MPAEIRHNWTISEIKAIYQQPLLELVFQAATTHRRFHDPRKIQVCHLISVKTGGCPENCKYCSQSSRYQTPVDAQPLLTHEEVLNLAKEAISKGATRICLGAAWREVRPSKQFDTILKMIQEIKDMGVEVCCTLGMLNETAAKKLEAAGTYAYNHNLDTSAEFYKQIVTTRSYEDRLNTLAEVEKTTMQVCCGGIIGMGETEDDRLGLLHTLATRSKHPESFPINILVPVKGTPFENMPKQKAWDAIRMVATARLLMPQAMVRLSAGRLDLSMSDQALCFLAGANSIHSGEKLLTIAAPNPDFNIDDEMFAILGLEKLPAYQKDRAKTND